MELTQTMQLKIDDKQELLRLQQRVDELESLLRISAKELDDMRDLYERKHQEQQTYIGRLEQVIMRTQRP